MIINFVRRNRNLFLIPLMRNSNAVPPKYYPPPSKFEQFKNYLTKIQQDYQRLKAALLFAQLQKDKEIYNTRIKQIEKEFKELKSQNLSIAQILQKSQLIENHIEEQRIENQQIQARFLKELDNIKIYGISNIAKQVIESVDHIKQAIKVAQASNNQSKIVHLSALNRILIELINLLAKYKISEFNPLDQPFNPNLQESIGEIPTQIPQKKNKVAQVKRTGFKIKQRLLRPAFVIIYV